MEIQLTPEMEKLVQSKVEAGQYISANVVVDEALRLFQEQDEYRSFRLEALKRKIQVGAEQDERGEIIPAEEVYKEPLERNKRMGGPA